MCTCNPEYTYRKKSNGESVNRLLFHCPVAMKLWCIVDLIASWQGRFVHHRNDVIWKAVPHCLMWGIWRERNFRSFEDSERSLPGLKLFFFRILLDWMSVVGCYSLCLICDLIDHCNLRDWLYCPICINRVYLGDSFGFQ